LGSQALEALGEPVGKVLSGFELGQSMRLDDLDDGRIVGRLSSAGGSADFLGNDADSHSA